MPVQNDSIYISGYKPTFRSSQRKLILLFCETYLVIYILNFEKVSKKYFFEIYLLYLKCFTKNQHQSHLIKKIILLNEINKLFYKNNFNTFRRKFFKFSIDKGRIWFEIFFFFFFFFFFIKRFIIKNNCVYFIRYIYIQSQSSHR